MKPSFYGWKLLAAFWVILFVNLAFTFYGASVINTYMAVEFNMDRKVLGLIVTVFMLTTGISSPFAAMVINRMGVRFCMVLGSILILVASLSMALVVKTGMQAVFLFGLVAGLGVITSGGLPAQTGVAHWFNRRRALAIAIVLSAPGIGGFIAAPLLNWLIEEVGNWRAGWWLVAGLSLNSILVATLFVKNKPESIGQYPDGINPELQADNEEEHGAETKLKVYRTAEEWRFAEAIKTPAMWLVMFCSLGFGSTFAVFLAHGVIHLQDLGHSPAAAASAVSVMTISTLIGNFLIGFLGDRIDPKYLWVIMLSCSCLAMLLLPNATGAYTLYLPSIFLGTGFGGSVVSVMTLLSNYYGTRIYAYVAGCAMAAQIVGSSSMPVLAGTVYDNTGSYANVFYSLAVLCVCGACLLFFIKPPERPLTSDQVKVPA